MAPDLDSVGSFPQVAGPSSAGIVVAGGSGEPNALSSSSPSMLRRGSGNSNMMRRLSASYGDSSFQASAMEREEQDNTGVGTGPGPLRHPLPYTLAELHQELEKEQEAVVNRLSRELTQLRQRTASVASTTSSASLRNPSPDHSQQPLPFHHRSPSARSSQSTSASQAGNVAGSAPVVIPFRDSDVRSSNRRSLDHHRASFSREQQATATSPLSPSSAQQNSGDDSPNLRRNSRSHRSSVSFLPPLEALALPTHLPSGPSPPSLPAALSRLEEEAHYRGELEAARRENEMLREQVRELEATIRRHRRQQNRAPSAATASNDADGPRDHNDQTHLPPADAA